MTRSAITLIRRVAEAWGIFSLGIAIAGVIAKISLDPDWPTVGFWAFVAFCFINGVYGIAAYFYYRNYKGPGLSPDERYAYKGFSIWTGIGMLGMSVVTALDGAMGYQPMVFSYGGYAAMVLGPITTARGLTSLLLSGYKRCPRCSSRLVPRSDMACRRCGHRFGPVTPVYTRPTRPSYIRRRRKGLIGSRPAP